MAPLTFASRTGALAALAVVLMAFPPAAATDAGTPPEAVETEQGTSGTLATVGLTAGWATFGQALPPGVAPSGLSLGALPTQTDVKNRWPDGSIRFAIVSAEVPSNGSYQLSSAAAATGTFTPAAVDASVSLTISGTVYTATMPASASTDVWMNGPLVREDRHVVAPVGPSGAHPFLRVNFDRRVYHDGQARVDVSVENMLDKTGATTVTYDVAVTVAGQVVFSKAAVQHYYLTRWRKVFGTGGFLAASVTPDLPPDPRTPSPL